MTNETTTLEATTEAAAPVDALVITGVALLYQRRTKDGWENKVRCVLVDTEEDDDEYDLKEKAERYIANHEKLSVEVKEHNLVAWNIAAQLFD